MASYEQIVSTILIGCSNVYLEFRVKFYASDPANLQEELTRYYFFRQVKKDLLESRFVELTGGY